MARPEKSNPVQDDSICLYREEEDDLNPPLAELDLEIQALLSEEARRSFAGGATPPETRRKCVDWVVSVNTHYSFSPLTAILAVNYLDAFISKTQSGTVKPWMTHLAATASLSLAAKVEETHVPLLLDLQVEDAEYIFEPKTIQRMEMLLLSTLQWRMNPVTPFSFMDYIERYLGLKGQIYWDVRRKSEKVLMFIISDWRFTLFLPSVLAMAVVLQVSDLESCCEMGREEMIMGILGLDKGKVDECREMILELIQGNPRYKRRKVRGAYSSAPGSPNAVIDAAFSSDGSSSPI